MNILILDDLEERHQLLRDCHPVESRTHVYTAQDCYEALNNSPDGGFDVAFLDHDLGSGSVEYTPYPREVTGRDVAKYICAMKANRPKLCIVHSANPPGAMAMLRLLWDEGIYACRSQLGQHHDLLKDFL